MGTVAADAVKTWAEKIAGFEDDIKSIGEEESLEREMRLADILANKSDNLQKYKKDIESRPAKQWIMTNIDKRKLKEKDNERIKQIEEEVDDEPEPQAKSKKRKREKQEAPQARKERLARERMIKRKEAEKAERLASERKVRASARRVRKA